MTNFKGKKVAVLGAGVEGISSAEFLVKNGADVTVFDKKNSESLEKEVLDQLKKLDVKLVFGKDYLRVLSEFDVIVRSPGIHKDTDELSEARKKGSLVTSQTKIFFGLCPAKIIGVTGTKGKGTTSSLIYEMLKKEGLDVYLGGNIGNPPLSFLDKLNEDSWVILELSSFQLHDLDKSPHIAVMLMVTSEHLDYHKDVYEYIDAKRNIFRAQTSSDFAIINKDYPASNESDIETLGQLYYISRERSVDKGTYVKDGAIWLKNKVEEKLIDVKDILLPGKHNFENVAAAAVAAHLAGVSLKSIREVLKQFKGLEHRLELVRTVRGVRYYDDSFSTTPETAIAAIEAFDAPEILILGGSGKESDFYELGKTIREAKNIKAIIGIGYEWERMKSQFPVSSASWRIPIFEDCLNMGDVVEKAAEIATIGDVVLLSPACASFGMFKNYHERGNQFKEEVNNLIV